MLIGNTFKLSDILQVETVLPMTDRCFLKRQIPWKYENSFSAFSQFPVSKLYFPVVNLTH